MVESSQLIFKGIELNSSAFSAIMIEAATEGQPDIVFVELFALMLFSGGGYWASQWDDVFKPQLSSNNAFVRFSAGSLLGRTISENDLSLLKSEPSELVRARHRWSKYNLFLEGVSFWDLGETEQIIISKNLHFRDLVVILLHSKAVAVSRDLLCDIIEQVLPEESSWRRELSNSASEDMRDWEDYDRIEKLWKRLDRFPIAVANLLISRLPVPSDKDEEILKELYPKLDDLLQDSLFCRRKVGLIELRRNSFLSVDKSGFHTCLYGEGGRTIVADYLSNWESLSDDIKVRLSNCIPTGASYNVIESIFLYNLTFGDSQVETDYDSQKYTLDGIRNALKSLRIANEELYDVMYFRTKIVTMVFNWIRNQQDEPVSEVKGYNGYLAPLLHVWGLKDKLLNASNAYSLYLALESSTIPREALADFGSSVTDWFESDPVDEKRYCDEFGPDDWRKRFAEIEAQLDDPDFDKRSDIEKAAIEGLERQRPLFMAMGSTLKEINIVTGVTGLVVILLFGLEIYRMFT